MFRQAVDSLPGEREIIMTDSPFTEKQIAILNAPLDPRFVSERAGGGSAKLKYIEGHDAIDQADRIFGFGN